MTTKIGTWVYIRAHDVGYCPLCDCLYVECEHCGNTSCNGGGCDKCCGTTCATNHSLVFSDNYKDICRDMEINLTEEVKEEIRRNNKELQMLEKIFGTQTPV